MVTSLPPPVGPGIETMNDTLLAIAVAELRSACAGEPDLIERVRKAMVAAQSFWMSTDDELRLRGALGAALVESDGADKDRLIRSIDSLRKLAATLNALQAGVSVNLGDMPQPDDDLVPIMPMWRDAKESRS